MGEAEQQRDKTLRTAIRAGSGVPSRSEKGRAASRAQATIRAARSNGNGVRRGEGKFGLGEHVERAAGLRRGLATLAKPARQKGLGHFGNPLLDQSADFFAEIGGMIQTRKLEAFERRVRCFAQIIPRWNDAAAGHGLAPLTEATISTMHNTWPANLIGVLSRGLWKFPRGNTSDAVEADVCSGCSGDYDGEFDDAGEPDADSGDANWLAWNCGEPDEQGSQRKSKKTRAFETKSPLRGDSRSAMVRGSEPEGTADVCEILVSGTRIIEIRMIAANDGELKELAGGGVGGKPPARQHSIATGAKYYRTRRGHAGNSSCPVGGVYSRGISAFVAVEFSRWMHWARKAFARSRARNSA